MKKTSEREYRDVIIKPMSEEQRRFIRAEQIKARERLLAMQAQETESRRLFQTRFDKPAGS